MFLIINPDWSEMQVYPDEKDNITKTKYICFSLGVRNWYVPESSEI